MTAASGSVNFVRFDSGRSAVPQLWVVSQDTTKLFPSLHSREQQLELRIDSMLYVLSGIAALVSAFVVLLLITTVDSALACWVSPQQDVVRATFRGALSQGD